MQTPLRPSDRKKLDALAKYLDKDGKLPPMAFCAGEPSRLSWWQRLMQLIRRPR